MTTRWEKGDSHVVLIAEGESTNVKDFQSALNINLEGNVLIDISSFDEIDQDSKLFLNEFAKEHKSKRHSIILVSPKKIKGLKNLEVVPTIPEARDMVFMEIAERELGFWGDEIEE